MENFVNELKLKVSELNELINNFEIDKLKSNANCGVDFSNLTIEQLEEIHKNYDILDIYTEDELYGAAADNAYSVNDVFDDCVIEEYVKDNFSLSDLYCDDEILDCAKSNFGIDEIVDKDELIDYVRENYQFDDIFDDDEIIEYVTSRYNLDDLASWR